MSDRGPKDRIIEHLDAAKRAAFVEIDKLRARVEELELENARLRFEALERVYDEGNERGETFALNKWYYGPICTHCNRSHADCRCKAT